MDGGSTTGKDREGEDPGGQAEGAAGREGVGRAGREIGLAAVERCYRDDPSKRPTAGELAAYLRGELGRIDDE